MSNLVVKFVVVAEFADGSSKKSFVHSKSEAKKKLALAAKLGGWVKVLDLEGKEVSL